MVKNPTKTKKKPTGRRCAICSHKEVKKINSAINQGASFRRISLDYGMSDVSVNRHAKNHLKLEIQTLIKEKKIENATDHFQEITEQLEFAKELRIAAREYLSDPESGKIVLIPRSDEISVVYEDYLDLTPKGNPKRKTDLLDTLLERVKDGNIEPRRMLAKHVDIRVFALSAIQAVDTVLDKFARIQGLYQKEKENEDESRASRLKAIIRSRADEKGITYEAELDNFLTHYADDLKPEIKERLISHAIN